MESNRAILASRESLRVTLASIGDGVITTDAKGRVVFLNPVAEALTGWATKQAAGKPLDDVFRIVHEQTRTEVENPALRALREGRIVGLANNTILIARDGTERPIDDSAAPIPNPAGEIAGAVLVFRDISERNTHERLVGDALDYATNIIDTLRHGFLVLDADLRVVSANRAFYRVFATNPGATVGRLVYELGDGQWNIPALRNLLERVLPDNGVMEDFVVEHDFPGMGTRVMALNARKVRKPGNGSRLILLVIEDISQRRREERALTETRSRLDLALSAAEIATWEYDIVRNVVKGDANLSRLFGIDATAVNGTPLEAYTSVIHPDDRQRVEGHIAEAIGGGDAFESEYRVLAHGETRHVLARGRVRRDKAGRAVSLPGVALDITARKEAERALLASERQRRLALDAANLGTWHVNPAGMSLETDARFREIFGVTDGDLPYEAAMGIIHPDDREHVQEAVAAAMDPQNPAPYDSEYRIVLADGSVRWVHAKGRANVVQGAHGPELDSFDGTLADVTERILMRQKINEQALSLADESRRKDEFLAMLSHELRNPLAPIRSAAHVLKANAQPGEPPVHQQAREIIERQVGTLTRLVDDLLEVARVISGRIHLQRAVVDLGQIVRHAVETMSPTIEQRGHTLRLTVSDDPGRTDPARIGPGQQAWVHADATRLEEVLTNLLGNAAKYTPPGGAIEVECEVECQAERGSVPGSAGEPDGPTAVVRVRDNGIGIDPQHLRTVFELFAQADHSLDRAQGGLGVGLSLASRLVELHGGTIEALSPAPGREAGSEFVVRLPMVDRPPAPRGPTPAGRAAPAPAGAPSTPTGKPSVLVVDDNTDLVAMLAAALKQEGYSVRTAYTGLDGLAMARRWRPGVVLLDIGLPGMDGYEVASVLRADTASFGPGGYAGRMVALTGYSRDTDVRKATAAGFDAHLAKPYDFDELEALMQDTRDTAP
ncbi:MAG: PAS domain S-box protein [Phycisphaera sp.]|nr:MAG: PAS domain S-box protein [Phycisphaera sp.]